MLASVLGIPRFQTALAMRMMSLRVVFDATSLDSTLEMMARRVSSAASW